MSKDNKRKMFYSMGEVSEMFDVNPSLIRYWEGKFDILKPHKNKKGNRMFTPEDVENLKLIYHLVKEKGMTLDGARKRIESGKSGAGRDIEIADRLLSIKAVLLEIRQELKVGRDDALMDEEGGFDYELASEEGVSQPSQPSQVEPLLEAEIGQVDGGGYEEMAFVTDEGLGDGSGEGLDEGLGDGSGEGLFESDVVTSHVMTIVEEQEIEPEYIAALSKELAEEFVQEQAQTAAEVMEVLAAMNGSTENGQGEQDQHPQVYEQTLF